MMLTLPRIPLVSPIAGTLNDGVLIGSILQSNPVATLTGQSLIPIIQVLRKDVTATGSTLTDITAAATDANTADFNPFGTNITMSLGDAFYYRVAAGLDTHDLYATIATAGVGTWGIKIQEYNVTSDAWEDVVGITDASNGFKQGVGTYKISYTTGAEGSIRLDDSSPKHVWHKVVISSFTSVSVAPVLSRIFTADTAILYATILPAEILPRVMDCAPLIVVSGPTMGLDITIATPASPNYTIAWEYLADDNTYKPFTNVVDGTNGLTASAGNYAVRWTIPTDWSSKSITDVSGVVHTGFILCAQIISVATEGAVVPPGITILARSFGTVLATGIYHPAATSYTGANIFAGVPSATPQNISFANNINGKMATITVPANTSLTHLDFSSALAIGAGESLIPICTSGSAQDYSIILF